MLNFKLLIINIMEGNYPGSEATILTNHHLLCSNASPFYFVSRN